MSSFCWVTPGTDLRNPCLVAFRGQAEVKGSLVRKHVDQNERSDLELPQDSERFGTRKQAVARLCAFDRGVFVDAEHRSDGKWLPDNPTFPVWSMTTRANEPLGSPRVCQNGTVIEQSGAPVLGPESHSVIHSSARKFCPPAAHESPGV